VIALDGLIPAMRRRSSTSPPTTSSRCSP